MNSKRYFSNLSDFIEVEEIENLFRFNPPFTVGRDTQVKVISIWLKNIP